MNLAECFVYPDFLDVILGKCWNESRGNAISRPNGHMGRVFMKVPFRIFSPGSGQNPGPSQKSFQTPERNSDRAWGTAQ